MQRCKRRMNAGPACIGSGGAGANGRRRALVLFRTYSRTIQVRAAQLQANLPHAKAGLTCRDNGKQDRKLAVKFNLMLFMVQDGCARACNAGQSYVLIAARLGAMLPALACSA